MAYLLNCTLIMLQYKLKSYVILRQKSMCSTRLILVNFYIINLDKILYKMVPLYNLLQFVVGLLTDWLE